MNFGLLVPRPRAQESGNDYPAMLSLTPSTSHTFAAFWNAIKNLLA